MAGFWITECIPIYITSLMPIFFLPAFRILSSDDTCDDYFKGNVVSVMASIMIALMIEYNSVHSRIALFILDIVGLSLRRIHLVLMIVTGFLSMWISNSIITALMCPIVKGILEELQPLGVEIYEKDNELEAGRVKPSRLSICLYISIAYAASIGGCSTIIGTGTNLALKSNYDAIFNQMKPTEHLDFTKFMIYSILRSWIILLLTYFAMELFYMGLFNKENEVSKRVKALKENRLAEIEIKERINELGKTTVYEVSVIILIVILMTVLILSSPKMFKGWSDFYDINIRESVPTVAIVAISFFMPATYVFYRYFCGSKPIIEKSIASLATWRILQKDMPWGFIFLVGSGFSLAEGCRKSGLVKYWEDKLINMESSEPFLVSLRCIFFTFIVTAFITNVATANLLLPIMAKISIVLKRFHPLYLMMPVGFACSMAFHLPISTPPNAIVCYYGNIKTKDLVRI